MAAKKHSALPDPHQLPSLMQPADKAMRPPLEDASDVQAETPVYSPAKALQDQLEETVVVPETRHRVLDTGRVLATSSGITAILGVFFFTGIW